MDWATGSALAEMISAAAVVISLIYLAVQIRSGTKALKTTIRDSVFQSLIEWNTDVMADPDLAHIFQEGSRDINTLTERERARFVHVMYSFFKLFENIYIHYLEGSAGKEAWESNRMILLAYSPLPGTQFYWRSRSAIFDPRFRAMVDTLSGDPIPSGSDMVKRKSFEDVVSVPTIPPDRA